MRQAKLGYGIGHAARLVKINRLRAALGHGAEAAAARAQVAEHHEGSSLLVPALAYIGTLSGLADRVEF